MIRQRGSKSHASKRSESKHKRQTMTPRALAFVFSMLLLAIGSVWLGLWLVALGYIVLACIPFFILREPKPRTIQHLSTPDETELSALEHRWLYQGENLTPAEHRRRRALNLEVVRDRLFNNSHDEYVYHDYLAALDAADKDRRRSCPTG